MLKHYLCLLLMVAVSIVAFRHAAFSAYEWPTMDMMPFLEKHYHPDFLKNDFYTNSFSDPNPRYVWGYFLIGLTALFGFGADWYQTVFILKIAFLLIYPVAFFYLLTSVYQRFEKDNFKNIIFQIIAVVCIYGMVHYEHILNPLFTVGDWKPYSDVLTPQTLSLFLGTTAILLIGKKYPFFYLFLFLSTWFHLSVGLLFSLLACICLDDTTIKKIFTTLMAGVVVPLVILSAFFGSEVHLSGKEFIEIYDFNIHPFHYIPSEFGKLIYSSRLIAVAVSVLFLAGIGTGFLLSNRFILFSSLFGLIIYSGGILIQYWFVELIPVKVIAILGPSRYTFLGYWMLVLVYGSILTDIFLKSFSKYLQQFIIKIKGLIAFLEMRISKSYFIPYAGIASCFLISCFFLTRNIDHPKEKYNTPFINWIKYNTPEDAVMMAPYSSDLVSILYISNRALFSGQGFPFNEKFMREAGERSVATFGSYEERKQIRGNSITEKYASFYRSHQPEYFIRLSEKYRIDYLIIETGYKNSFSKVMPVYSDEAFCVYSIKDLKSTY